MLASTCALSICLGDIRHGYTTSVFGRYPTRALSVPAYWVHRSQNGISHTASVEGPMFATESGRAHRDQSSLTQ